MMWRNSTSFLFKFIIIFLITAFCNVNKVNADNLFGKNDSLLDVYYSSEIDSIRFGALVKLAFVVESDSAKKEFENTADYYLQLTNKLALDSLIIDKLAHQIDRYGVIFRNDGNYASALKFHNWAQDFAKRIRNLNLNSIISNNKGVVYRRLDDYQLALENHLEALRLAEETRNMKSQAIAINSIGNIQMMIGNHDEALIKFKQSLIIEQKLDNLLGIAINLNNIGNVYSEKNDYDKALEYFSLSLDVNKEINSKKGIAICYTDIGHVYMNKGDINRALSYYEDALQINKVIDDKYGLAYAYLKVGELYAELKQYDKSLEFLLPGIDIALSIGAKAFIVDGYEALYKVYMAQKKHGEAIGYLILSHQYHDSILNVNVRKDIVRLQIKYESERKEAQIELLERNASIAELYEKRQSVITLLILSALVIALGFVVFLSYYLYSNNRRNKLLLERNRSMEKAKEELDSYSRQLLIAKQEAESNSKVKSEFLANMSHEIRTPLNSVIGFAEVLENSVSDLKHQNQLQVIKSSARTLLTLINDILDLSKIEAGKFTIDYEPVNPQYIFDDIIQIFSYRSKEKGISLTTNISPALPSTIVFNELRLRQILFNVIGNAIKFTENGGIIVDAASRKTGDNEISLMISVSDTGIGISEDEIESIFEPFHQSKSNGGEQGTGLGLAITKRLVEMMNGTITLTSTEGMGSRFSIQFPNIKIGNTIFEPPMLRQDKLIRLVLLSRDGAKCSLLSNAGIDTFENETVTNLEDAKVQIQTKNVVVICGFTIEESINAINVLKRTTTEHRVVYVVMTDIESDSTVFVDENVFLVKETISNEELVKEFNMIFNDTTLINKSNTYFTEFFDNLKDEEFISEINKLYLEEFIRADKTKMSSSIVSFANRLEVLAKDYELYGILQYSKELKTKVNNFEVEEMDKLLHLFETNFKQIIE